MSSNPNHTPRTYDYETRAAIVRAIIRKGDQVRHLEHGDCTVLKVRKDGAVMIRIDESGIEGTASAQFLRRRL